MKTDTTPIQNEVDYTFPANDLLNEGETLLGVVLAMLSENCARARLNLASDSPVTVDAADVRQAFALLPEFLEAQKSEFPTWAVQPSKGGQPERREIVEATILLDPNNRVSAFLDKLSSVPR
ncbi:MAG: hypothetical protein R3C99_20935 [Pirellulaceae bacterium]|nr:hypothetical protein [Planctomycetales bacterium]